MVRADPEEERDAHLECRNLVWAHSPEHAGPVPGIHCVNRIGVVHILDCPVYQGIECCLFDARAEGEAPKTSTEEECEEIAARLAPDFLRWTYWRRIGLLREKEAPPAPVALEPDPPEVSPPAPEVEVEVAEPDPDPPADPEPPSEPPNPEVAADSAVDTAAGKAGPSRSRRRRSRRRRRRKKKGGEAGNPGASPPAGS